MESEIQKILQSNNHYTTLGVSKSASNQTIKENYRKLAKLLHPDRCSKPNSTTAFQKVSDSYQILSDEKKTKRL